MIVKVLDRKQAAYLVGEGDDFPGDAALVVAVAAVLGDLTIATGQIRILEHLAHARRSAIDKIRFGGVRILGELSLAAAPVAGDDLGQRVAVLGIADTGLQDLVEAHRSKAVS